jgi:oligopeptide/dipeptide ABC transporter ATP-binding protein
MYLGRIVEIGPAAEIYENPRHPYTVSLLRAIPEPDPTRAVPRDLPRGEVPDAAAPPLGCRFHPRCPRAFEVCGWESRDLRAQLETRWAHLEEREFEAERALVGNLAALDQPGTECVLPAGAGKRGEDAKRVLDELRAEAPDDPFWKGVASATSEPHGARVRFQDYVDPRQVEAGPVRVLCHLYDDEALARATAIARRS